MISMLKQGNTGAEILSILDALTADNVSEVADSTYLPILGQSVPTLEEIAFWYNPRGHRVWHSVPLNVMIDGDAIRQLYADGLLCRCAALRPYKLLGPS